MSDPLEDGLRVERIRFELRGKLENLLAAYNQDHPPVRLSGAGGRTEFGRGPLDEARLFDIYRRFAISFRERMLEAGISCNPNELLAEAHLACKNVRPSFPELVNRTEFRSFVLAALAEPAPTPTGTAVIQPSEKPETQPASDPHRGLPPDSGSQAVEKPGSSDKPETADVIKAPEIPGDPCRLAACPPQGIAKGAMGNFLAELFDQFDQEEQAGIRAAEDDATRILAQGTAAANGRRRVAESLHDNYWLLQPENDAWIDSAGVVFVAYVNALWRKTDAERAECIDDFLAKVKRLVEPILTIYGDLGKGLIEELREDCDRNARQVHSMLRTSPASATSSTEDSAASSSQDGAGHAGRRSEATDANEQSETETGQYPDANRPVVSVRHVPILEFSDPWRKRVRQNADKNAWYARQLGRNPLEAGRQEDLLEDARAWAKAALRELVQEVQDLRELKERVVKQTEEFIQRHRYYADFQLGYLQFGSALWEEGWPSLEECALEAVIGRADSASQPREGITEGAMVNPFLQGAKDHPYLHARWDSLQKLWTLHDLPLDQQGKPDPSGAVLADPETARFLKEATRIAVRRLRQSRDPEIRALAITLRDPLYVWLDLMRTKERGFRRIPQLTRWRGGKSMEEFLESGLVPPDARLTENGNIVKLFQESTAFWDDLVDFGFDSESAPTAERRQPADQSWPTPGPADDQSSGTVGVNDKDVPSRRSPREFVDDARLCPRRSYEKFAAHLGISKDTLYAITLETRWVKNEIYKLVAMACTCKPEDLHPRDIPLPERRRH